jgi:oligopeptide/dipeptide ABC transporter ATP-binding protein
MMKNLIEVKNLKKYFPLKKGVFSKTIGFIKAVDDVSFNIKEGETLGLVGESGCGKTTIGRVILRLMEKSGGEVYFQGLEIFSLKRSALLALRKKMQIIFQDPYSSLNPRLTIGFMLGEILKIHKIAKGKQIKEEVARLLEEVGLSPDHMNRYPHEFSGGQRQRICIARALAVNPKFIVCDEPVSALDVSIQAQIINLLKDLSKKFNLTYLFIAHDLSVVKHISNNIAVMYLGKIVEIGDRNIICNNPLHPYTKLLLSCLPIPDPTIEKKKVDLDTEVPSALNPPSGCHFHPRCSYKKDLCEKVTPDLVEVKKGHFVSCHLIGG